VAFSQTTVDVIWFEDVDGL